MNGLETTPCAFCPRLCRHACPVATATGSEAAVPATIFSLLHAHADGRESLEVARGAASLCLGCGACTEACLVKVPVADRLRSWRASFGDAPAPVRFEVPAGAEGWVCVMGPEEDWHEAWSARTGHPAAALQLPAEAHAAWLAGDPEIPALLRQALEGGRIAVVARADFAELLARAGVTVVRLPVDPALPRFRTCYEDAETTNFPGQLACCGRREGFAEREPLAARDVAEANVAVLGGDAVACADEACARWLRAHGADVRGPLDLLRSGAPP